MDEKERRKRLVIFATFLLSCLAIGLLSAALGTDHWLVSRLQDLNSEVDFPQRVTTSTVDPLVGNESYWTARQIFSKNRPGGSINFGLFHGFVRHNKGLGERQARLKTVCEVSCTHLLIVDPEHVNGVFLSPTNVTLQLDEVSHTQLLFNDMCLANPEAPNAVLENVHLFNHGLWAATIFFTSAGIFFGIVGAVFSLLNTTYTPVAVINGIAGLYLWNSFGVLCSLLAILVWVILFYITFQYNVLPAELLYPIPKFTTCGIAELGHSLWLCVAALLIFAANIIAITLKDVTWRRSNIKHIAPSGGENLFMY